MYCRFVDLRVAQLLPLSLCLDFFTEHLSFIIHAQTKLHTPTHSHPEVNFNLIKSSTKFKYHLLISIEFKINQF